MTEQQSDSLGPTGNQLHDEAADWFALMRGPDAKMHQPGFEAWLSRGALHRAAYNRIAEIFSIGKGLKKDAKPEVSQPPSTERWRGRTVLVASLALCLAVLGWWGWPVAQKIWSHTEAPSSQLAGYSDQIVKTSVGQIRSFRLADGSIITLDTNSVATVAFSRASRLVRLVKGRARFDVAHAQRPFQVAAGLGIITAHGTVFDVSSERHDVVAVSLLRGAIDVRLAPSKTGRLAVKRLKPGQSLSFQREFFPSPNASSALTDNWPEALVEFDNSPLALVVERANRYTAAPIILEGDGLDVIKISGLFRITDTELLAARIARLLNLELVHYPGRMVLRRPQK